MYLTRLTFPSGAADHLRTTVRTLRGDGRGWVLLTIATSWFVVLGIRFVVPALLPVIKDAFALDNAVAGVVITVIWASYALVQFPTGILIDIVGERVLLTAACTCGGLAVALIALAPSFPVFVVACGLLGLGTGLYGPARGMAIARLFPDNDGTAFGVTLASGNLGASALPAVATLLVAVLGWRYIVGGFAPVFAVMAVVVWTVVPGSRQSSEDRTSVGDLLSAVDRRVLSRSVVVPSVAFTAMMFGFQGLTAFLPTYLVEVKRIDDAVAGLLFATFFVTSALFQLVSGNATDAFGYRRVFVFVAFASTLTTALLPFVSGAAPLFVLVALMGIRSGAAPPTSSYVIASLPDEISGTMWGAIRSLFMLVGALGSSFVGVLADNGFFGGAFVALAAISAGAGLLYLTVPPTPTGENDA